MEALQILKKALTGNDVRNYVLLNKYLEVYSTVINKS